ncbi:MAG: DUF4956 domain-containing protein [bacterium]|nr:DUF4956 domain-containing protein [bacterium]
MNLTGLFSTPGIAPQLTLFTIIINLAAAFVLSFLSAIVYRATHKGLSYSQSFTVSLVLISFLIAAIVMVIGNSLALAFAAFGAMSLVRFRTAIKDTRDIAFVLLSVAIGFASGTGSHVIAFSTTILGLLIVYILWKVNFGSIRKYDYVLSFSTQADQFSNEKMRSVFGEFLKYDSLLNLVARENGKTLDQSFNIRFINSQEIAKFAHSLGELPGVSDVDIISAKNDIEY